ncbi:MAG: AmmeMemoRadiSam system radical SAM enzyme [Phycisphaera sp.]|nr:AmmeMemoRadiSam system radical SAM enzyme [Phycisphaera sp.]
MALKTPQAIQLKRLLNDMTMPGELYDTLPDGRLMCYACGHECKIGAGKEGVCRVRYNADGELRVPTGYVAALACDPIEKKPFFHAFPGRDALSFGMMGCDLHCSYCQNWVTSQAMRDDAAVASARPITPRQIINAAIQHNAPVITSTYNEPLITSEWAMQVMRPAKEEGFVGSYVSNGNATRRVLEYIRPYVQLYKVDLKSFRDRAYRQLGGQLPNVLRTIRDLHAMGFWIELVTLIVPGLNDTDDELKEMADFIVGVSPDLPWHVTAFHSDYHMPDTPNTQVDRLLTAAQIGADAGLRYVYAGNRPGMCGEWEDTRCPTCRETVIKRSGFRIVANRLKYGRCPTCQTPIPGFWDRDTVVPQENMGTPMWITEHPGALIG